MAERKQIWLAVSEESAADGKNILISEEEEIKLNFSLQKESPEKGKGAPLQARNTASTDVSTVNANLNDQVLGADYSHITNSFKVGPTNNKNYVSFVARYLTSTLKEGVKKVTSRSFARGR